MKTRVSLSLFALIFVLFSACSPPPIENVYRKNRTFLGGLNVPVALIVAEWGGKPRVMGSAWLVDGGNGKLFTAKHVTDVFMNSTIELGANECKVFLGGKVYTCIVTQVPPLRDAVMLKILEPINKDQMPVPYKISTTKLKIGEKIYIQGFHTHPSMITKSNMTDGFRDLVVPIFKDFYELRMFDPARQREVVFDSLEATVVHLDSHIKISSQDADPLEELKYKTNEYVEVITARNHKFSFGGLSGGVAVRVNNQGVAEAVGIVTAERPERLEYDKKNRLKEPIMEVISDTILITPIESVKDLYDHARIIR